MRKIAIGFAVCAALTASAALAGGPSGSHEDKSNNVTCGSGQDAGGVLLYAGSNGLEACNAGANSTVPQGRIIVSGDQGGYVAVDGDKDNPSQATGYIRLDSNGVHCGGSANEDSSAPDQSKNGTCEGVPVP